MPTQRESFCCHEMEQIKHLLEDPSLEVHTQHADLCLLFRGMHIYIAMKVLKYLMMKTGMYHGFYLLC